jgi:hypothetical protein
MSDFQIDGLVVENDSCNQGGLGKIATVHLMSLSHAHALRLANPGA